MENNPYIIYEPMNQLQDLIKLRSGIDSLSQDEFITFMISCGKKYFSIALFEYLKKQIDEIFAKIQSKTEQARQSQNSWSYNKSDDKKIPLWSKLNIDNEKHEMTTMKQNIDTMNNSIKDIILSREIIDNPNPSIPTLDNMVDIMISNIGSFLDFDSRCQLEICSRNIFISLRSHPSLHKINAYEFQQFIKYYQDNTNIHWNTFKELKEIIIDINDCVKSKDEFGEVNENGTAFWKVNLYKRHLPNINWNNIQKLSVYNIDKVAVEVNDSVTKVYGHYDTNIFKICKNYNFKSMKIFRIYQSNMKWDTYGYPSSYEENCYMLNEIINEITIRNVNIECMDLWHQNSYLYPHKITLSKQLKAFQICCNHLYEPDEEDEPNPFVEITKNIHFESITHRNYFISCSVVL
eukprot:474272_1